MSKHGLLSLPPEILEFIFKKVNNFKTLFSFCKGNEALKCLLAGIMVRTFRDVERRVQANPDLRFLAAEISLVRVATWPHLDDGLCTPAGASALDSYMRESRGVVGLKNYNAVTNYYLKHIRWYIKNKYENEDRIKRIYYSVILVRLLKTYNNNEYSASMPTPRSLSMSFVLRGSWLGIMWTQGAGSCSTFRFPQEAAILFNILAMLTGGHNTDTIFTALKQYITSDRVVSFGFQRQILNKFNQLMVSIDVCGDAEFLRRFLEDDTDERCCEDSDFSFYMNIRSGEARKRGCPGDYQFNIVSRTDDLEYGSIG